MNVVMLVHRKRGEVKLEVNKAGLIALLGWGGAVGFILGAVVGATPSEYEEQQAVYDAQYAADVTELAGKYHEMYQICEQKYQLGIDGYYDEAHQLLGRQNKLWEETEEIRARYQGEVK